MKSIKFNEMIDGFDGRNRIIYSKVKGTPDDVFNLADVLDIYFDIQSHTRSSFEKGKYYEGNSSTD